MIRSEDESRNGAQVNRNCSNLVSPPSINNGFKAKGKRVPQIDLQSSKSLATGRFLGSKLNYQSPHKSFTDNVAISNVYPSSIQNPETCSGSCDMNSKDGKAITSSEASTAEKAEKRRRKRKTRKVKRNAGSTNPQGQHQMAHRNSTSKICGNNNHGNKLVSGTPPEVSSSDDSNNNNDLDGSIRDIRSHKLIMPRLSNNEDVAEQNNITCSTSMSFPGEQCTMNSELVTQENDEEYSSLVGSMEEAYHMQMHCQDIHSNNLLDCPDSLQVDSVGDSNTTIETFDTDCSTFGTSETSGLVAQTTSHCESRKNGSQDSSSGDIQYMVPGKITKQTKAFPMSSKVHTTGDNGKFHNRVGKENSHSVWQKVQKTHVDECNCEVKKPPVHGQYKIRFKEVSMAKMKGKVGEINASLGNEVKKHSNEDFTKRLERKCAWCLKQNQDCCSKGGSPPGKDRLSANAMLSMQCKAMPKFAAQENGSPQGIVTCSDSESVLGLQGLAGESESLESACGTLLDIEIGPLESQDSSLLKPDDNVLQTENATSSGVGKQNHGSGSVLQKWVPVATKFPELTRSGRTESSSIDQCDSTTGEVGVSKKTSEENISCGGQDSSTCSKEPTAGDESKDDRHVSASCLSCESKRQNVSAGAKSNNIIQAINDAYRIQLEAEAVWMTTGNPIAEFERILYLSSPVICKSPSSICNHCSQNQIAGMSLCRHDIPDIKLGCLWKWYEKHGSFGLEVRAEDFVNSRRLGIDQFGFRAYFVPLLSAIQLFKNHIDHSTKNDNEHSVPVDSEECELCATSERFDVGCHPALSSTEHHLTATQSVDSTLSNDLELLFEFFESDQPQKRKPLYEKIQELVQGHGSSTSKMFGDPIALVSPSLHDLHPASWYSVAWYPIYTIPDGNLRAAFLTYHSLGHLVRRSDQSDSTDVEACVVSPVVGLQSYNAQGECWFRLQRGIMSKTKQIPSLNHRQILKERLKTLEVTASLMARAMVYKGDETSVNMHPDYEFFLSRRRYRPQT